MGLEPTISCLGSKRSTTELHPRDERIIASPRGCVKPRLTRDDWPVPANRLLFARQQFIGQFGQSFTGLPLWIGLAQTVNREIRHLARGVMCGPITGFCR